MLNDIILVEPLDAYNLRIKFEDGIEGVADISKIISFEGIFKTLIDKNIFDKVRLNKELGTIEWENGADIDPVVLYAFISGTKIPDYFEGNRV